MRERECVRERVCVRVCVRERERERGRERETAAARWFNSRHARVLGHVEFTLSAERREAETLSIFEDNRLF